jgi:hypothetical protein
MENKDEKEQFNLDTPFINNYVNWIWMDVMRYQDWSARRYDANVGSINRTKLALKRLLVDMPLKGLEYVGSVLDKMPEYKNMNDIEDLKDYAQLDFVFGLIMNWLQTNLFEAHLNFGKPKYTKPSGQL